MEPRQEEMLTKDQECHPERRKQKQSKMEGIPSRQNGFQEGGDKSGRGGSQNQETADTTIQLPNSFQRGGPPKEKAPEEQSLRSSSDYSGLYKDGSPNSSGEEMVMLKRAMKKEEMSPAGERRCEDSLMGELSEMVQNVVKKSSWWERHGIDDAIITMNFLLLPVGFLLLRSYNVFSFLLGIVILGVAHYTITAKGSHLASHNSLVESKSWGKVLAIFFLEVCSAFTAEQGSYNHVKLHHGYTNVIGLGDSSTWKLPFLNRYVYMFIAPIAVPVLTPLVAISLLKEVGLKTAIRSLCCIFLGLYSHYWLLLNISEFQSVWSALTCMLLTRSLLAHPYIHVNIFQVKPVVSQYLKEKNLPYNEDSYLSRLKLFLNRYEELMVHAPPITELVGIQ
ncbi:fatty acid desaturase 6 isoform X2 [Paroedura picta]|uniref:fatty acid desaturase 6 isoform X2 n=1 Tax=Paroedura picta TaxID=143630 RepID=UPI004057CA4C